MAGIGAGLGLTGLLGGGYGGEFVGGLPVILGTFGSGAESENFSTLGLNSINIGGVIVHRREPSFVYTGACMKMLESQT